MFGYNTAQSNKANTSGVVLINQRKMCLIGTILVKNDDPKQEPGKSPTPDQKPVNVATKVRHNQAFY